jgi:hypothetical protein
MANVDQRMVLERLIRERGDDYANLSHLLERNPAYIQQFMRRGIPRELSEGDRRRLARYFGVDEQVLGGPEPDSAAGAAAGLIPIPRYDIGASAGPGAFDGSEVPIAHIGFDPGWLRQLCRGRPEDLSIIRVRGDSMSPTLADGDDIMIDRSNSAKRLADGIYVLRRDDTLIVKRVAVHPASKLVTISSDNGAYPTWSEVKPGSIDVVGRVVWTGRRVS